MYARESSSAPAPLRHSYIALPPPDHHLLQTLRGTFTAHRRDVISSTDIGQKFIAQLHQRDLSEVGEAHEEPPPVSYGETVEETQCFWRKKWYGKVHGGMRNYAYSRSKWFSRRFRMKKHKIIKRMRFRRYKVASVANLPFSKMIRVGLLPELKSSKSKPGESVEGSLGASLVTAAKSASGMKEKGKRKRPRSKYQA
jgi:hypothetical protein